jgi:two-component system sensor histidine kinase UhpB
MVLERLRGVLQRLWYDRPVRTQLLIAVGAINLLAACVAGGVSIYNTRTATTVEIEAQIEVAQRFVAATIKELAAEGQLDRLAEGCHSSSSICAMCASC